MKIKLIISYDGSSFYGSQIQPNKTTIHSKIQEVFSTLHIYSDLEFSGRTDRGVHAFKQVISATIPSYWSCLKRLQNSLNKLLPNSIYVRYIYRVGESFHARFDAKKREYRYIFTNKQLTPFNQNYLGYYTLVDREKILETISLFKGIHDFEYFSKKGSDPKSTVREIYNIQFYEHKNLFVLRFIGNSFLRSQVRMMVEAIMKVSSGKLHPKDIEQQLTKKRLHTWTLASPNGLYLSKISYS